MQYVWEQLFCLNVTTECTHRKPYDQCTIDDTIKIVSTDMCILRYG